LLDAGEIPSDDRGCSQVTPEIGATATPVIDPTAGAHGILYVLSMSKDSSNKYHQRLHALDLNSGAEQFAGPVEVQASAPSGSTGAEPTFNPAVHKERAGLLLTNGVVYTAWGSHCDAPPYVGWIIGYDRTTLQQVSVLSLVPNGSGGGFWNAGSGPAADSSGNIFALTGNGTFDTNLNSGGLPEKSDYGNALVKIAGVSGPLRVTDYFTMLNTAAESSQDLDFGSGGAMLLPPLMDTQGNMRQFAVAAGKDKHIYVVDQTSVGHFSSSANNVYQDMANVLGGGVWSSPAWFNGTLYYGDVGGTLKAFKFANGAFPAAPTSQTVNKFSYPGTTPSISANGGSNGIVWATEHGNTAVLHAYDANDLSKELYNSNQAPNNLDHFGSGNKFIVTTIVNGRVYVGTTNSVAVFGLLSPATSPAPSSSPSPVSVSPSSGGGSSQIFTYVYADANGYTDIAYADAMFGADTSGVNACWVLYSRAGNGFYLLNDSASAMFGPVMPGSNSSVENGQCVLNGLNSTASVGGINLTLNLNIAFKPGFTDSKNNYLYVQNNAGQYSGWQKLGTWNTGTGGTGRGQPTPVSVSPSSGSGSSQIFTYVYADANGYTDIAYADAMFGADTSGVNACWVLYSRAGNGFYLLNDSASTMSGPVMPGSNSSIENGQCILNGLNSTASVGGTNLTLNINITFKPGFTGSKNDYLYVQNNAGQYSGWQKLGTWNTGTGEQEAGSLLRCPLALVRVVAPVRYLLMYMPTRTDTPTSLMPTPCSEQTQAVLTPAGFCIREPATVFTC
jgi:hypothetical protein